MNKSTGQLSRSLSGQLGFFAFASFFVLAVLLFNEVLLRYLFGMNAFKLDIRHLVPYLVIPMGILLIGSRMALFWTLFIFTGLQLIWFGTYRYFGDVIGPDLILLGTEQVFEIGIAAAGEWQIFILPIVLVVFLNIVFAGIIHFFKRDRIDSLTRLGIFLVALPFIIVSVRGFLHSRPFVLNPSSLMPSHTGVVQALSLAIRNGIVDTQFTDRGAARLVIGEALETVSTGPVTVALIMGESISPQELGIFGRTTGTTPRLAKRLLGAGKLTYFPKVGFAAGTSTMGSVPLFMRMSHNPVAAFRRRSTVFEIARKRGFSVGYYSAQKKTALTIGGGIENIDRLETKESWIEEFKIKRDGILIDQMRQSSLAGKHQFFFIHQRSNHVPYICDLKLAANAGKGGRSRQDINKQDGISRTPLQDERLNRYRRGLLCYDRSLDNILSYLENKPGELYLFITADHNELMGEKGLWGHNNLEIQTALVPMILATNRPDSAIARRFSQLQVPSAFEFMQIVTQALGQDIHLDKPVKKMIVNGMISFGRRGYIEAEKSSVVDKYTTSIIMPDGRQLPKKKVTILGLKDMQDYLEKNGTFLPEQGLQND